MRLSVIVASSGRSHLSRTVQNIAKQLVPGDELLVDVNDDAPWGHAARNRMMPRACGDMLAFMDDDDIYANGALAHVREQCALEPERIHVFKMRYHTGWELWEQPELRCGNISTQMFVVPNVPELLGAWGDAYAGDWDFISQTASKHDKPPVFHERVIALLGPK